MQFNVRSAADRLMLKLNTNLLGFVLYEVQE
jgi:hypothetical protein